MIRARFSVVHKAKKGWVSRVPVNVNAKTVDALNSAMERAVHIDLLSGVRAFRDDVMKVELDRSFNAKSYDDLRETRPFKNLDKSLTKAAERLGAVVPDTSEAVRQGIKGGTSGSRAKDRALTEAIDFDHVVSRAEAITPTGDKVAKPDRALERSFNADNPRVKASLVERREKYLQDLIEPPQGAIAAIFDKKNRADTAFNILANSSGSGKTSAQIADELKSVLRPASSKDVNREIRNVIGLNQQQVVAMANQEMRLRKEGMSEAKIRKEIDAYSNRALEERCRTIAITETRAASGTAQVEAWLAMQEDGALSENAVKIWVLGAEDACPNICYPTDGQRRPLSENFTLGNGKECFAAGMAHPRCRCLMVIEDLGDDETGENEGSGRDSGAFYSAQEIEDIKNGDDEDE